MLVQVLIEWNAGGAEKSQSQVETTFFTKLISFYPARQNFDSDLQKVAETLSYTLSQS